MNRKLSNALIVRAREHNGVLSTPDAVELTGRSNGVTLLLRSGGWQEVLPGVLAPAAVEVTTDLVERATAFWAPGSALSHYSGARKNGIWVPDSKGAFITVPYEANVRSRDGVKVFRTRNMPATLETDGHAHWTQAPRTVVDLASKLTRRQFDAVLLSGIRGDKLSAAEVDTEAASLRGRKGVAMARASTALWTPERETLLEDGLYDDLCAAHPADEVRRQFPILRPDGSVLARFDMAIEFLLLAFEADGLYFHSTDLQIAADQRRDRMFMSRGWLTVRFREGPLSQHAQVQREIRAIIEQRRRQLRIA